MRSKVNFLLLYAIVFSFFLFLLFRPNEIVFAATPTPSPPSVSDSPDPQYGGGTVTFSCPSCTAAAGETLKLYICDKSDCFYCKMTKTNAPSPTFSAYGSWYPSTYVTQNNPGNTVNEDNTWGYISVFDAWVAQDEGGNWTWDFGNPITGTFRIKWFARITGDSLPSYCVDVYYGIYVSNDGSTWTAVRTGEFYHAAGAGAWSPYTSTYIEAVSGTYRYVRASIYSTTSCIVTNAELWVDVVSVDQEIIQCWGASSAVSSAPSATYTCPSCTYVTNTYYGITCSQQEHPATCSAITSALTFTCKKENLCACSAGECFNDCKADPDGAGAWCCNTNQCSHDGSCYTLVELPSTGSSSACILGENIAHNSQGSTNYRYAVYDGQLYYCGTSNADRSPYPEVTNLISGDKIGLCQCNPDGTWNCGGVIRIRGGRIKIV
jgi:hypothetical protein